MPSSSGRNRSRRTKKTIPSFDVGPDALSQSGTGWVYRSETEQPATAAPAPSVAAPVTSRAEVRSQSPPSPPSPSASSPPPRSAAIGWIESGVGLMVLPLTLAIVAMVAPVLWILGPRALAAFSSLNEPTKSGAAPLRFARPRKSA